LKLIRIKKDIIKPATWRSKKIIVIVMINKNKMVYFNKYIY